MQRCSHLFCLQAHPPIHPTKHTAGEHNWNVEKTRLYEFIVRSFLATCSKAAVGFETRLEVQVAGEGFSATGKAAATVKHAYNNVYHTIPRQFSSCFCLQHIPCLQLAGSMQSKHTHPAVSPMHASQWSRRSKHLCTALHNPEIEHGGSAEGNVAMRQV